jgi:hypothetical protein
MRSAAGLQARAGARRHVLRIRIRRITNSTGLRIEQHPEMATSAMQDGSLRDERSEAQSVNQGETACLSHPEVLIF